MGTDTLSLIRQTESGLLAGIFGKKKKRNYSITRGKNAENIERRWKLKTGMVG